MRGKGRLRQRRQHHRRITPAYAGKSRPVLWLSVETQDHPRLCGEKLSFLPLSRRVSGSPPPMRGKALGKPFSKRRCRITPAYAGKSQHGERDSGKSEDHPRLCGEKHNKFVIVFHMKGSPPPMRGKAHFKYFSSSKYRITPAYAGKRVSPVLLPEPEQDHPRLCGEKSM